MQIELVRSSHSVGRNLWVFEWCTKYRYKMMGKWESMKLVEACIRQAAHRHSIKIISIKVLPEHVHMAASLPKGMNEEEAVKLLKGASSRKLFEVKEKFALRYPRRHFWSRGYFAHTIGVTDLQTQIDYVENQEMHHGVFYTA
ncbi:MAG: IS200/IS605 family transposase [Candidatus Aenigmarchaeota archaeon]|nr:IS200/IS605 family transposase [Candidatus Aenigmarchaeota archaeon]